MGVCASQDGEAALHRLYELKEDQILSQTTNSLIFRGIHKQTNEEVAIKRIEKQSKSPSFSNNAPPLSSTWEEEVAILRMCTNHPTILALRDVFETKDYVFLITELAAGGELFTALINEGAYSEWDAKRFAHNIFDALRHLHAQRIVHRDIKPENLLLTTSDTKSARIKVADFGAAKRLTENTVLSSDQLTWAYCAPEVLQTMQLFQSNESEETEATEVVSISGSPIVPYKSDIWSVGIVLYVLLSGVHPFDPDGRQSLHQMVESIIRGSFSLEGPMWDNVSADAKSMLKQTLSLDPSQRPSAADALNHAWFHSPHTPRSPLRVSLCDGLDQYQRLMRKKFRTSVFVAMAAQSLRRSLQRVRSSNSSASAVVGPGKTAAVEEDERRDKHLQSCTIHETSAMFKVFKEQIENSEQDISHKDEVVVNSACIPLHTQEPMVDDSITTSSILCSTAVVVDVNNSL